MSDDDGNSAAIPAWQRNGQPATSSDEPKEVPIPTSSTKPATADAEKDETGPSNEQLRANMQSFLLDPAVKDAPKEKKRAFFESKGIHKTIVEEALNDEDCAFNTADFDAFKQQQQSKPPTPPTPASRPQQRQPSGPPIIMYPEHLEEAHKPPPLVTLSRLVNTAYTIGGLAALVYGASKYLVTPMSASLTEARHEFAGHSQEKIDLMNQRLEKLVSKIPPGAKTTTAHDENAIGEDTESETSDPTELYHRDMGTQTSPAASRRSSTSSDSTNHTRDKDPLTHQNNTLSSLTTLLNELLSASSRVQIANQDRHDSLAKLRQDVDAMVYGSFGGGLNVWSQTEEGMKKKEREGQDAFEELKREIRGVKGVLLSAKRFPGPGRAGT